VNEDDDDPAPRRRRPRGRFHLTAFGLTTLQDYRLAVVAAQSGPDARRHLEQVQAAWAGARGLQLRDALVLDEIGSRPQNVAELGRSLDDCGVPKADIADGIDRLESIGLIEVALPPPVR
jgi:hypothetical protein